MESLSKKTKVGNITHLPYNTFCGAFTEQFLSETLKIRTYIDGVIAKFIVIKDINGQKHWVLHCSDGHACLIGKVKHYYLLGEPYTTREKWFAALTAEQKYEAVWNND